MKTYYSEADVHELMKELELSIEDREKLQAENEDLWAKLQKAEAEKQQLQKSLQEQTKLMKQLCESSDSDMPIKLNEKLNEQEKLLSTAVLDNQILSIELQTMLSVNQKQQSVYEEYLSAVDQLCDLTEELLDENEALRKEISELNFYNQKGSLK